MADVTMNIDGGTPIGGEVSLSGNLGNLVLIASAQLKDEMGVEWPPSKTLPYLNLFLLETINLQPEAYPVEENIDLAANVRQSLGETDIALIDALYILTVAGSVETPISAVRLINKKNMDHIYPGWVAAAPSAYIAFIIKDDSNPKVFFTYPPSDGTGFVKLLVSQTPPVIDTDTTELPFDNSYYPACVDYLIYRCLAEETTIPNAQAKSQFYYNKYLQDLGLKRNTERQTDEKS